MKTTNFYESLAVGNQYETMFFNWLQKYKLEPEIMTGYHKEYDLISGVLKTTFEIKADLVSRKTNRWAIEYAFGAPSGLSTTTADFWVFSNGEGFWYVHTDTLRDYLLDRPMQTMTGKGDLEHKHVKYLSHDEMCKIATQIKYLDMDFTD